MCWTSTICSRRQQAVVHCGILRCVDQVCYLGKLYSKDLLVFEVHEEAVHQQLVVDVPRSCRQTDRDRERQTDTERGRQTGQFSYRPSVVLDHRVLRSPFHILESLSISWSTSEEFSPSGPLCRPTWHRTLLRPSETPRTDRVTATFRLHAVPPETWRWWERPDVPEYWMIWPNQLRAFRAKHWWATTDECITSTLRGFDWRLVFLWTGGGGVGLIHSHAHFVI